LAVLGQLRDLYCQQFHNILTAGDETPSIIYSLLSYQSICLLLGMDMMLPNYEPSAFNKNIGPHSPCRI